MKSRKRKTSPNGINGDIQSQLKYFHEFAEGLFRAMREDRQPPAPITDSEWRRLLDKLSISCRKTAKLYRRFTTTVPLAGQEPEPPAEAKRTLGDSGGENGYLCLLNDMNEFLRGSEQSVGGLDKGLELLARYCDIRRARSRGPRGNRALTELIKAKLAAWIMEHGEHNICNWDEYDETYYGEFIDEMERTLERLDYRLKSPDPRKRRNALGQRIKKIREQLYENGDTIRFGGRSYPIPHGDRSDTSLPRRQAKPNPDTYSK